MSLGRIMRRWHGWMECFKYRTAFSVRNSFPRWVLWFNKPEFIILSNRIPIHYEMVRSTQIKLHHGVYKWHVLLCGVFLRQTVDSASIHGTDCRYDLRVCHLSQCSMNDAYQTINNFRWRIMLTQLTVKSMWLLITQCTWLNYCLNRCVSLLSNTYSSAYDFRLFPLLLEQWFRQYYLLVSLCLLSSIERFWDKCASHLWAKWS